MSDYKISISLSYKDAATTSIKKTIDELEKLDRRHSKLNQDHIARISEIKKSEIEHAALNKKLVAEAIEREKRQTQFTKERIQIDKERRKQLKDEQKEYSKRIEKENNEKIKKRKDELDNWAKEIKAEEDREIRRKKMRDNEKRILQQENNEKIKKRKDELNNWVRDIEAQENFSRKKQKIWEDEIRREERNNQRRKRMAEMEYARVRRENLDYISLTRTGMYFVTAPSILAGGLSLRNAMQVEQMKLQSELVYGEDSKMVFEELKQYAIDTAFTIREAMQLANLLKPSAKKIGVTKNEDLVNLVKSVGNVMIAQVQPEDYYEITRQLSQVASRGYADERQDISVLQARGMQIQTMLEEYTGMDYKQIKEKYGARIPADLIYKAIYQLSRSKKMQDLIAKRSETISQAWGEFAESMYYFSSEIGFQVDEMYGIRNKLKSASSIIQNITKGQETGMQSLIAFAIGVGTIGIPIAFFLLNLRRLNLLLFGAGATGATAFNFFKLATGIGGVAYGLIEINKLVEDLKKDNTVDALNKHAEEIAIGVVALTVGFSQIKNLVKFAGSMAAIMRYLKLLPAIGVLYGSLKLKDYLNTAEGQGYMDKILDVYYSGKREGLKGEELERMKEQYPTSEELGMKSQEQIKINLTLNNQIKNNNGVVNFTDTKVVQKTVKDRKPVTIVIGEGQSENWR